MPITYKGYTINDVGEPSDWSPREVQFHKDIIDMLPEYGDTIVTTQHVHAKLVSPDKTKDPVVLTDNNGRLIVGNGITSADTTLHVYDGSAGNLGAPTDSVATIENSQDALLAFLAPDANKIGLIASSQTYDSDGGFYYDFAAREWKIRAEATDDIMKWDASAVTLKDGVPIKAGGTTGLELKNTSGNGIKIDNAGNLILDSGELIQFGNNSAGTHTIINGEGLIKIEARVASGSTVYLLGTSS
jgi:hypothetical protein